MTIVYVKAKRGGRHHVFYSNGTSAFVNATQLQQDFTMQGVYCLNVWSAPCRF